MALTRRQIWFRQYLQRRRRQRKNLLRPTDLNIGGSDFWLGVDVGAADPEAELYYFEDAGSRFYFPFWTFDETDSPINHMVRRGLKYRFELDVHLTDVVQGAAPFVLKIGYQDPEGNQESSFTLALDTGLQRLGIDFQVKAWPGTDDNDVSSVYLLSDSAGVIPTIILKRPTLRQIHPLGG